MPDKSSAPARHSYLLRLHNQEGHTPGWRASLQDIRTGEWRHFADLAQLFIYLTHQPPEEQSALPTHTDTAESAER